MRQHGIVRRHRSRYILRGLTVQPPHRKEGKGKLQQSLYAAYTLQTLRRQKASFGFLDGTLLHMNQLTYAVLASVRVVQVKSGEIQQLVTPGTDHRIQTAAASVSGEMPADFRVSITNASGKNAYPISSFTWLLIPNKIDDQRKKQALTNFLRWMMTDGQKFCEALAYAPLPKAVVAKEMEAISRID